ncbi:MAG: hypothetical protein R2795_18545 [Saprospiraceae bacterium]
MLSIPVTGGGTCSSDMVLVSPVAPPTNPNFATDVTICKGGTTTLGVPAEAGLLHMAVINYLPNNMIAQPTFTPGSLSLPNPDPILYYVTAEKEGCIFVDEVLAHVIEARAWVDGCGPRLIGEEDQTININKPISGVS